jgi:hypothetical protein
MRSVEVYSVSTETACISFVITSTNTEVCISKHHFGCNGRRTENIITIFIIEARCVFIGVRTEYLNIIWTSVVFRELVGYVAQVLLGNYNSRAQLD